MTVLYLDSRRRLQRNGRVFCPEAWHLARSPHPWDSDTRAFLERLIQRARPLTKAERERLNDCHRSAQLWRREAV
jgi:hypothetical protein